MTYEEAFEWIAENLDFNDFDNYHSHQRPYYSQSM